MPLNTIKPTVISLSPRKLALKSMPAMHGEQSLLRLSLPLLTLRQFQACHPSPRAVTRVAVEEEAGAVVVAPLVALMQSTLLLRLLLPLPRDRLRPNASNSSWV